VINAVHRWEHALDLLTLPPQRALRPSAVSYGSAADRCAAGSVAGGGDGSGWAWALTVLSEAREGRLATLVLYTAALSALGARWLLALSLLREAVEGRAAPDTPAATAAVVACGEAEEWPSALYVLSQPWAPVPPSAAVRALASRWRAGLVCLRKGDVDGCNAVLAGAGVEHWERGMQMLQELRCLRLGDVISYNSAISNCIHWPTALILLAGVGEMQLRTTSITYNAVVSACQDAWQVALLLVTGARHPNAWNAALHALALAGHWRRALRLLEAASKDPRAVNAVVGACEKAVAAVAEKGGGRGPVAALCPPKGSSRSLFERIDR
ncbi:unnamed protein product, partial [Durusdinium trenchii]